MSQTWQPPTDGQIHSRCSIHVFPSAYLSLFLSSSCNSIPETCASDYCQSSNASRWPRCKALPALEQVIHHSFAFSPSPAQLVIWSHWELMRKWKHCHPYCSGAMRSHCGKIWERKGVIKKKRNLPGTKLCCLGPPSLDFKDTFS